MLLSRWLPLISGVMRYFSLYSHTANLSSSRLHIRQEVCRGGGWSGALNLVQFGHAARSTFKHFKRHAVQQRCRGSRVLVSWLCRMKLGRKITNKSKLNVSVAALHLFGLTSWFGLGPVQTTVFGFFFENAHVLHLFGQPSIRILKPHFFENGSQGWEIRKRIPPVLMCTANPHTSHNNNNNGGLHVRVRAAEDIEPFLQLTRLVVESELQQQFDLINCPHKRFWFPYTSHFHLLAVFSFSVNCLFTVWKLNAHAPCLLLRFWWMSSAT